MSGREPRNHHKLIIVSVNHPHHAGTTGGEEETGERTE